MLLFHQSQALTFLPLHPSSTKGQAHRTIFQAFIYKLQIMIDIIKSSFFALDSSPLALQNLQFESDHKPKRSTKEKKIFRLAHS